MGKVLSAGYAELYEAFLDWQRARVSASGFETIRTTSYQIIRWLETEDVRPLRT